MTETVTLKQIKKEYPSTPKECSHKIGPLSLWIKCPPLIGKMRTCLRCGAVRAGIGTVTLAANHIEMTHGAAPGNPVAGLVRVYADSATGFKMRDDGGVETDLAAAAAGSPQQSYAIMGGTAGQRWCIPGWNWSTITERAMPGADFALCIPIWVERDTVFSDIGIAVRTGEITLVRVGIYDVKFAALGAGSAVRLFPDVLKIDAGTLDMNNPNSVQTLTLGDITLTRGYWFVVAVPGGTTFTHRAPHADCSGPFTGISATAGVPSNNVIGWSQTPATALPNPAPAITVTTATRIGVWLQMKE